MQRIQSSVSSQLTLNPQQIPILMPTVNLGDAASSQHHSGTDSLKSNSTHKIPQHKSSQLVINQTGLHKIDESVNESKKASSCSRVGEGTTN